MLTLPEGWSLRAFLMHPSVWCVGKVLLLIMAFTVGFHLLMMTFLIPPLLGMMLRLYAVVFVIWLGFSLLALRSRVWLIVLFSSTVAAHAMLALTLFGLVECVGR